LSIKQYELSYECLNVDTNIFVCRRLTVGAKEQKCLCAGAKGVKYTWKIACWGL